MSFEDFMYYLVALSGASYLSTAITMIFGLHEYIGYGIFTYLAYVIVKEGMSGKKPKKEKGNKENVDDNK